MKVQKATARVKRNGRFLSVHHDCQRCYLFQTPITTLRPVKLKACRLWCDPEGSIGKFTKFTGFRPVAKLGTRCIDPALPSDGRWVPADSPTPQ